MLFISRLTLFWRRLGRCHCAPLMQALYLDGLTAGGVSYVLFWTLAFNCTHMYGSA